ncbi:MAG: cystathionine beta-lyase [Caulobacteraceae bacterium]
MRAATRLVHSGEDRPPLARTVPPPIVKGSTVLVGKALALYDGSELTYGLAGLATHQALKAALADLEGAQGVELFPSGLAAITGAMLAVLKAGDEVLVTDACYRPTRRFCDQVLRRFGVGVSYHPAEASPHEILAAASPATRLIVLESPGSLSFEMQDVPAIAALARARGVLTLMDNTWAAGLLFQPLAHGVDLSVQALTKYVGGGSDLFMGSVAAKDPQVLRALEAQVRDLGWAVSPEDAYQMLRGLRSLDARLRRHAESALAISLWLTGRDEVAEVLHPGLEGAAGHEIWKRDYQGACGLFGFVLRPRTKPAVEAFLDALEIFGLGFSWGGFESLAIDAGNQLSCRIYPTRFASPVLRLSIGLEDPGDLIADLERGFSAIAAADK